MIEGILLRNSHFGVDAGPENLRLFGGASRDRTDDLIVANDALSIPPSVYNHQLTVGFYHKQAVGIGTLTEHARLEFASRTQQGSSTYATFSGTGANSWRYGTVLEPIENGESLPKPAIAGRSWRTAATNRGGITHAD
jgi:hypothetical protein